MGKGVPDLLVAYHGHWYVLEVKDGNKSPSRQRLTQDEQEWHDKFSECAPVYIVKDIKDAAVVLGMDIL